jgi:hypothetical protein
MLALKGFFGCERLHVALDSLFHLTREDICIEGLGVVPKVLDGGNVSGLCRHGLELVVATLLHRIRVVVVICAVCISGNIFEGPND